MFMRRHAMLVTISETDRQAMAQWMNAQRNRLRTLLDNIGDNARATK
jgi:hypothetical protein